MSRPKRWNKAILAARHALSDVESALEDLRELQGEYEEWRDNMPTIPATNVDSRCVSPESIGTSTSVSYAAHPSVVAQAAPSQYNVLSFGI